jgi:hypothetical protein
MEEDSDYFDSLDLQQSAEQQGLFMRSPSGESPKVQK